MSNSRLYTLCKWGDLQWMVVFSMLWERHVTLVAWLGFMVSGVSINMATSNRNYKLKKRLQLFCEGPCVWLNNLKFVDCWKSFFIVFFLCPLASLVSFFSPSKVLLCMCSLSRKVATILMVSHFLTCNGYSYFIQSFK